MTTAPLSTLITIPLNARNAQAIIDLVVEAIQDVTLSGVGTGYVICAGGRYARYGYATCRCIREVLKDETPIELWVGNDEDHHIFTEVDNSFYKQADVPGGWPLKARAVLKSSFQKVILLDADCIPFVTAGEVWASEAADGGAVFFPDVASHRRSDWPYAVMKLRMEDAPPEMEAGQVVIDRVRHARAVVLTDYFNQHPEFFYREFHGDKDLWALALARLGIPFTTGNPCVNKDWGLAHYLPDGAHYSDHLIHTKNGKPCPHPIYQSYLDEYARLVDA